MASIIVYKRMSILLTAASLTLAACSSGGGGGGGNNNNPNNQNLTFQQQQALRQQQLLQQQNQGGPFQGQGNQNAPGLINPGTIVPRKNFSSFKDAVKPDGSNNNTPADTSKPATITTEEGGGVRVVTVAGAAAPAQTIHVVVSTTGGTTATVSGSNVVATAATLPPSYAIVAPNSPQPIRQNNMVAANTIVAPSAPAAQIQQQAQQTQQVAQNTTPGTFNMGRSNYVQVGQPSSYNPSAGTPAAAAVAASAPAGASSTTGAPAFAKAGSTSAPRVDLAAVDTSKVDATAISNDGVRIPITTGKTKKTTPDKKAKTPPVKLPDVRTTALYVPNVASYAEDIENKMNSRAQGAIQRLGPVQPINLKDKNLLSLIPTDDTIYGTAKDGGGEMPKSMFNILNSSTMCDYASTGPCVVLERDSISGSPDMKAYYVTVDRGSSGAISRVIRTEAKNQSDMRAAASDYLSSSQDGIFIISFKASNRIATGAVNPTEPGTPGNIYPQGPGDNAPAADATAGLNQEVGETPSAQVNGLMSNLANKASFDHSLSMLRDRVLTYSKPNAIQKAGFSTCQISGTMQPTQELISVLSDARNNRTLWNVEQMSADKGRQNVLVPVQNPVAAYRSTNGKLECHLSDGTLQVMPIVIEDYPDQDTVPGNPKSHTIKSHGFGWVNSAEDLLAIRDYFYNGASFSARKNFDDGTVIDMKPKFGLLRNHRFFSTEVRQTGFIRISLAQ